MSSSSRRTVRTAATELALDSGTRGSWSCRMHRFPHGRLSGCGVSAGSAWQRLRNEGSGADEYSSRQRKEELSAPKRLWRRSEPLIGIGHPKLERVSKIDPASSAFFRESGHERGDRLGVGDPRDADRDLGELREKVEVPNHEGSPRQDGDRPLSPQEHLERVARDTVLPLDELVRIRGRRDRDEASGKLPYLLRDNRRRVSLHDDGRTPLVPVHPHQARRITKDTGMVTAYVWIERVIDSRERILAQGGVDHHFTTLEVLARRGEGDA